MAIAVTDIEYIGSETSISVEHWLNSDRVCLPIFQGINLGKVKPMPQLNENSTPDKDTDGLVQLVKALGLNIPPEDLADLAQQLRLLDALERDELQDFAPILKMDAGWHD